MATTTHSAYTPVSARRTFAQLPPPMFAPSQFRPAPPPPPPPPPPAEKTKVDWPDSVRTYVQRAFASENEIQGVRKEEMEVKLKAVIAQAVQENALWSTDWSRALLPQQIILNERNVVANPSWGPSVAFPSISETNSKTTEAISRKRKSSEFDTVEDDQGRIPPWHAHAHRNAFEDRITYPDKRQRGEEKPKAISKSQKRKQRFENGQTGSQFPKWTQTKDDTDIEASAEQGPVIGRCQDLEKKYFRLTSAPNPETVRPLPVLEKTLDFLKKKWRAERNYSYICDQLKSLRQDLTVQHIKTGFTVNVYELHARIALEKGDLGEYNQCQTQLRALYSQQLGGHPEEFKAYRILYFIHTCNKSDMNDVLADLTAAEKREGAIKHALDTRSALALGNYHRFFQLYLSTPNMGAYLLDMFVTRERLAALSNICISFKPDVRLRFVTEELGFESDDESARFICDQGGQIFLEAKEDGDVRLLTGKALRFFETVKAAAFKTVDIKGQI